MDLKLVDYSSSSSNEEQNKHTESKRIAIVQPVQQDKSSSEQFSENVPEPEFQPEQSRQSSPHPTEEADVPLEIEIPEPEVIVLSSDSETISFHTDTTLGQYLS